MRFRRLNRQAKNNYKKLNTTTKQCNSKPYKPHPKRKESAQIIPHDYLGEIMWLFEFFLQFGQVDGDVEGMA